MRILLSNDDGVYAKGILVLAEKLSIGGKHEVVVVAPDRQKSASGHSITLHKPLHIDEVQINSTFSSYKINGTPADCVKMGIHILMDTKPDVVISGINAGPNLGTDVFYSGTVSAAAEGALSGIPAIAVSACGHKNFAFETAANCINNVLDRFDHMLFQPGNILNINVPSSKQDIHGVRITKLGERSYSTNYEKRLDPLGRPYYWLIGKELTVANDADADIVAIRDGYISITPIRLELTDQTWLNQLKQISWNVEGKGKGN